MRFRIVANLLSVLCAWILWEKWILQNPGEPTARVIQAVLEAKTLEECRDAAPGFAKKRAEGLSLAHKAPEYSVTTGNFSAILLQKRQKGSPDTPQQYLFYCLPPTVDPFKAPD